MQSKLYIAMIRIIYPLYLSFTFWNKSVARRAIENPTLNMVATHGDTVTRNWSGGRGETRSRNRLGPKRWPRHEIKKEASAL